MQRRATLFCVKSMLAVVAASAILTPHAGAAINAGSNWTWQNPLPQGYTLNAISCFTTNNCIALGDNGIIIATTNGGTTWAGDPSVRRSFVIATPRDRRPGPPAIIGPPSLLAVPADPQRSGRRDAQAG
jgi:hypothetical protein